MSIGLKKNKNFNLCEVNLSKSEVGFFSELSGLGLELNSIGKKIKALALVLLIGMAAFAMSGCTQPTESTTIEDPADPTDETEDPTDPADETEDPTTPVINIKDTAMYKYLESFKCINLTTEKLIAPEGHYQPQTGDILEVSYDQVDNATDFGYKYTLDTENSKEGDLKFIGEYYDTYGTENVTNTVTVNKEEKSITFHDIDVDKTNKFTFNEDGTVTGYERFEDGYTGTCILTVGENGSLYGPRGETFANIKLKLAE